MRSTHIFCVALALTVGACSYVGKTASEEPGPRAEMAAAETLSAAGRLDEAAERFASVAARYPDSRYAKEAAWNAALLYASPSNPSPDDSAATRWLLVYRTHRLEQVERQSADACLFLFERIAALKDELARKSTDAAGRVQRIRDLESQLKQATEELQKMKEIDVKLHQRGGKK